MTAPTSPDAETTPSRAIVVSDACSPLLERMLARHDMLENLYKKMEERLTCDPMDDGMLARMNASLGFSGDHAKTREYRPYCVRQGCSMMPRMMRVPVGFECWQCGNVWNLQENTKARQPEGSAKK